MTTETPAPSAEDQPGAEDQQRVLGFPAGSTVDVREIDDVDWKTLQALSYRAKAEDFEVPVHTVTDFASVPRVFVWFIPRYGRYTRAAILHDYLCHVIVPTGSLTRVDADGIFRQAMRELGVSFLRRWIMWGGVRLGALGNPAGRKGWWAKASWRVVPMAVMALPILGPAAVVIAATLLVFYLIELLIWIPLTSTHGIRVRLGRPAKKVNRPALRWRL